MVQAIMLVQRSGVNDVALPPDAAIDCSWFMRCALNLSRLSSSCLLDCLCDETTPFVCPFMRCPFIFVPPFMWWSWMVLLLEFSSILFFFSAFSFCTLLLLSTSTELWLHPICQSMKKRKHQPSLRAIYSYLNVCIVLCLRLLITHTDQRLLND